MRLSEYIKTAKVSGQDLAARLGVSQPVVSSWAKGRKPVPEKRCVAIERITCGAVTRRDLRPDDWADIWPELADASAVRSSDAINSDSATATHSPVGA